MWECAREIEEPRHAGSGMGECRKVGRRRNTGKATPEGVGRETSDVRRQENTNGADTWAFGFCF